MQNLFNSYSGPKLGTSVDPNWKYIKSGLQRNIAQTVTYYRTRNFSVKNNHVLIKLLNSASVSIFSDISSFYSKAQGQALRLASVHNLTTSVSRGDIFNGVFLGNGTKEIIIASDEYKNPQELEANWQDVESVTFLDHPKSDTSLLLANGKAYSEETGYAVINVNIPALLVQYRQWLKEQKSILEMGGSPFPTSVFIYKYILPNMLYSQLDIAIFNRLINLINGAPMGKPLYRHAFNLVDFNEKVDKALLHTIKRVCNNDRDFYTMLREVPLINKDNLLLASILPPNAPTRQLIWAELIARLKTISFILDANPNNGKKLSREQINYIKLYFDRMFVSNGLEQIPDKRLINDIEAEIIRIKLRCM